MIGKCLCGEIQFELHGEIPNLYQCHCKLCRKQGGAASNVATIIQDDQLVWISGQENISYYKKDTGFSSDFCSSCGSPVPNQLRETGFYWVPAGLLEDDIGLKVVAHIYTKSKACWDEIANTGTHFDEMPSVDVFQNILQDKHD